MAHRCPLALGMAVPLMLWGQGARAATAPPATPPPAAAHDLGSALPGRMTLQRTSRRLAGTGDPIWQLKLEIPGERPHSFQALVGRAARQQGDRHSLGSQAPLPRGRYSVSEIVSLAEEKDLNPELGQLLWIGLEPDFSTNRRGLGIHLDPSAGKPQDSGTDGCIGLIHPQELLALGELLRRSGTISLQVLN